jgi:hypothetical protein
MTPIGGGPQGPSEFSLHFDALTGFEWWPSIQDEVLPGNAINNDLRWWLDDIDSFLDRPFEDKRIGLYMKYVRQVIYICSLRI